MPGAAPYPGAAPLRPPRFNPSPAGPGRPVKPRGGGTRRGGRAHPRGTRPPAGGKRGQRGDMGRRRGWAVPAAGAGHGGGPTRDAGTREWARRECGRGGRTAEEPPRDLGTRRGGPGEVGGDVPSAGHGGTAGRGGSGGGRAPSPRPRGTVALSAVPERALSAVPAWVLGGSCATRVSRVRVPLPPSLPPSQRGVPAAPRVGRGTRGRARLRRHNLAPAVFAVPSPARLPASEISQAGETDAGGERWASRAARG